jgi:D-alanyl-D-alanine carboxypeptidase
MTITSAPHLATSVPAERRRLTALRLRRRSAVGRLGIRVAAVTTGAGLLLVAAACSSADDTATPTTTAPPTSAVPPTTSAPPTSPAPPTSLAPPTTSEADTARRALLSGILESHRASGEFVGARIALRDRDGTITEVTSGTRAVDPASDSVDPSVPWNIGSATKMFVAVVVLQLAEEGRLDLDAGIDRFLPELPGADRITPRQLLQHTSGLGEYLDQPAVQNNAQREWTPSELITVAEAAGRAGDPGGPYHYSNTNYIVLGEIIEQVTGHSWADEVRTRIVEPLGMTGTGMIGGDAAAGHIVVNGSFVDGTARWHPSVGGSAGGLQSTDRDLLLLATALADGTLLSPATQKAMQTFVPGEDLSQFGVVRGVEGHLDHRGGCHQLVEGCLGPIPASVEVLQDAAPGDGVGDRVRSGVEVEVGATLEVYDEAWLRDEVRQPVPPSWCPGDEEPAVHVEHPDLDATRSP